MHSNNNNKLKNFIQGLRPFSSSIPKTLKKYLKKGGYNYSNIVDNWTKIVSKKISDSCYPITIKMGKEMRNGTLILNVLHGKELEIEYSKKEIIDKINSFFGNSVVEKLKLNSFDDEKKVPMQERNLDKNVTNNKYKNKIYDVKNEKIKKSLFELTKVFREK